MSAVKTVAVSDHDRALWSEPSIQQQMPVRFGSGSSLQSFSGQCAKCKRDIPANMLHGRINMFPTAAVIDAVGCCRECKLFTRFLYRFHDDLSLTAQRDGRWVRWRPTPQSFWRRAANFLGLRRRS